MFEFANIWALFAAISALLLVGVNRRLLDLLDPVSYFFLAHLVLTYAGIFYRQFYSPVITIDDGVVFAVSWCLLLVALGVFFYESISKYVVLQHGKPLKQESPAIIDGQELDDSFVLAAWSVLLMGGFLLVIFMLKSGTILWFSAESDDLRIELRRGAGWLSIGSIALITYSSIALATYYLFSQRRLVSSMLVALLAAILILQFGNRGPAFEVLVIVGFLFCIARWRRLPGWVALVGVASAFLLLAVLGIVRQGLAQSPLMLVLQAVWRPFVNIQNISILMENFPDNIGFLHGKGYLLDLAVLWPGYQPNLGTWIKESLGMTFSGGGLTISYIGELYVNFGKTGIFLGSFVTGCLLAKLSSYTRRIMQAQYIPLIAGIVVAAKAVVSSGIVSPVLYLLIPTLIVHVLFETARVVITLNLMPVKRAPAQPQPNLRATTTDLGER